MNIDGLLRFDVFLNGQPKTFDLAVRIGEWTTEYSETEVMSAIRKNHSAWLWGAAISDSQKNRLLRRLEDKEGDLLLSDIISQDEYPYPGLLSSTVKVALLVLRSELAGASMVLKHADHCGEDNWEAYHLGLGSGIVVSRQNWEEPVYTPFVFLRVGDDIQMSIPTTGNIGIFVMRRNEEVTAIKIGAGHYAS